VGEWVGGWVVDGWMGEWMGRRGVKRRKRPSDDATLPCKTLRSEASPSTRSPPRASQRSWGKSTNSTTSCTVRPLRRNSMSSRILSGFAAPAGFRASARLCVMAPPCPASAVPDGGDTEISRCGGTANLHANGSSVCATPRAQDQAFATRTRGWRTYALDASRVGGEAEAG
jgi:hypothetical protein